mmetsp:Transcript_15913/g.34946  ORF Transcript_15913/g.34946 Transcript_15913/m.34946 type:complete len:200 (+) Transcript_15913:259-858(+)
MTGSADMYLRKLTFCVSRLSWSGECLTTIRHCCARMRNGSAQARYGSRERLHCSMTTPRCEEGASAPTPSVSFRPGGTKKRPPRPWDGSRVPTATQDPTARSKKTFASEVRPSATSTSTNGTSVSPKGKKQRRRARPSGIRHRVARASGPGSRPMIARTKAAYAKRMPQSTMGKGNSACMSVRKNPRTVPMMAASQTRR